MVKIDKVKFVILKAIFIYSRLNSERLPGKAMMNLSGDALLTKVIKNLSFLPTDFPIILLTSNHKNDDVLVSIAEQMDVECYRGSLNNVASRTVGAINRFKPDYFIRVNGDCPVQLQELYYEGLQIKDDYDIVSNIINRTYNYGISFELIKSETFLNQVKYFNKSENEHITSYFYKNLEKFKTYSLECSNNYYDHGKRLAVDDIHSYRFVNEVFNQSPQITKKNIHELNKELVKIQ